MRRLLSLFTAFALVGLVAFSLRDLLAAEPAPLLARGAMIAVLAAAGAALALGQRHSMERLRLLEVVVFVALTLFLAVRTYDLGIAALSSAGNSAAAWNAMLLRFALLMVCYGIFVPNRMPRAVLGVLTIGTVPVLAAFAIRLRNPELRSAFDVAAGERWFETLLLLLTAAFVAAFAAFLTGNLFDFAYEQRRRMFYDLEEKVGSGGMGEVWRARHRTLSRPTALKLIREDRLTDTDPGEAHRVLLRFEREAKATAALRSPHTIDVYDFGVTGDGHFFYAMEYLEGLDLQTLVEDYGPVPAERAVHLVLQACDSLAEAHDRGLTHRDIKPANLFLSNLGPSGDYIKILDFGLVQTERPEELSERLTAEGVTAGTPAYMAPEMAIQAGDVDHRSDIYALGGVAYWLLTGKYLFEAENGLAMIVEQVKTTPEPPSRRTELPIPAEIDRIVMRCLEKDPEDRYQSTRDLAADLAAVSLPESWTPARATHWWRVHRPPASVA
jgi:serine/threonine-protein kinase